MNTTLLPQVVEVNQRPAGVEAHEELTRIAERVLEVPQPDTPRLDIHQAGCQVSITWQSTEETFRLEVSDHAYVHGDWQPVTEPEHSAGGVNRVVLPGANHLRFVRLARARSAGRRRSVAKQLQAPAPRGRISQPVESRVETNSTGGEGLQLLWFVAVAAAWLLLRNLTLVL